MQNVRVVYFPEHLKDKQTNCFVSEPRQITNRQMKFLRFPDSLNRQLAAMMEPLVQWIQDPDDILSILNHYFKGMNKKKVQNLKVVLLLERLQLYNTKKMN